MADCKDSAVDRHRTPMIQVTQVLPPDDTDKYMYTVQSPPHVQRTDIPTIGIDNLSFDPGEGDDLNECIGHELCDMHTPLPNLPFVFASNRRGSNSNVFVFDPDCVSLYSRRGSYISRRGSGTLVDTSSLAVPSMKQKRIADIYDSNALLPGCTDTLADLHLPPHSPGLLSTHSAWSELLNIGSGTSRRSSEGGISDYSRVSNVSSSLSEHLRHLVRAFSSRTEKVKESTMQPPSPSSLSDYAGSDALSAISAEPQYRRRLDSFLPGEPEGDTISEIVRIRNEFEDEEKKKYKLPKWLRRLKFPHVIEPQSKLYLLWLFIVTLAFMYNAWAIPLRAAFPYQTAENVKYWLICDYVCDAVYIIDILLFKMRISFLNSGLKEIQTFWEFYSRCDHLVRSSHAVRIMRTFTYMLFLIHVETCGYYSMSVYEGIGINEWVYNGEGNAYIRCFYLATKTATSIGNNPTPQNELEYMFMTVYWVSGVFVFALLIGQIRDIFDAFNMVKTTYTHRMDGALNYVKNMNLPKDTQDRVRTWFIYNWQQQKVIDERSMMDALPMKLRKDLAIHVHFNTLSKVKLFSDCDKTLLYDLVLKLKPILYLPGDYVCKKGEIGKEMYIVSQGIVEVVGGPNNSLVLATLREGSVFGEISLLAMAAEGNRRTADVRCKGFTNLFILSKVDFENAMKDYPEAHKLLKKRAKKLLRMNARIERQSQCSMDQSKINTTTIIHTPPETPKLVKTVLQMMDPESALMRKLSNRRMNEHKHDSEKNSADGTDNGAYEPGSDYHIGARRTTNDDVEDFYDDILSVHDWDEEHQKINNEMINAHYESKNVEPDDKIEATDTGTSFQKKKTSESSTSSSDSGVQDTKVTSPDSSTTRSASNKDSKESFISNTELGEIVEDIDDCDMEPTRDAINYTADMFGDIESQPRRSRSTRSRSANKSYRLGSGIRGGGSCIVRRDDEYTKSFANGFTIIIDSVDDIAHFSSASFSQDSSSDSGEDDNFDHDEFADRNHSVEKKETVTKTVTFQEENEPSEKDTNSGNDKIASAPQPKSTSVYTNNSNTTLVKPIQVVKSKPNIQSKNKLGLKLKIENEKTTDFSPYMKSSANKKKTQTNKTRQQHNMSKPKTNSDNHSNSAIQLSESAIIEEGNDQNHGKIIERTQSTGNIRSISVSAADDNHSVDNIKEYTVSQNQVTCFADVHRETTLSPKSTNEEMATLCSPDMPPSARQRKISVISIGSVLKDGRETLV